MRRKCPVCGLYVGATPHSGTLHKRIMANRDRVRRGLMGRVSHKLGKRRR